MSTTPTDTITVMVVVRPPVLLDGLAARFSELSDFEVVDGGTSAEALVDKVKAIRPAVLVLGSDVTAGAAEMIPLINDASPDTAVVMVLDREESETAAVALRHGASACVSTETSLEDLMTAVRWARRGEMWISPRLLSSLLGSASQGERAKASNELSQLSEREIEILDLLVQGLTTKEVADRLHIRTNTVRTHTRNIQLKLHAHSNLESVSIALEKGIRPN